MARKKGKSVSFDAMVKFFMQSYEIPTKKDLESVFTRLDRIETLVRRINTSSGKGGRPAKNQASPGRSPRPSATASDQVLKIIERTSEGVGVAKIKEKTGFGDKKLRNIIFRLNKMEKIRRISRGIYCAA